MSLSTRSYSPSVPRGFHSVRSAKRPKFPAKSFQPASNDTAKRSVVVHDSAVPISQELPIEKTRQPVPQVVDFLVLGSGIAGLSYALKVAEHGTVAVVTKEDASEGSTVYAQGGVSAVLAEFDRVDDHVYDTMVAGDFLNCRRTVETVCKEGPAHVLELARLGANFTKRRSGELHLTQEGGHSARRVVHAEDATGREIERALLAKARAHPRISLFEHHVATDFVIDEVAGGPACLGADVFDQRSCAAMRFVSPVTLLATGGAGQVYPVTTNPGVCTGDGMAMASRASAQLNGMEFVQFHPTGFHAVSGSKQVRTFLISEAVRGEGGLLYNAAGHRFMPDYDPRKELAPRDIVARAIQDQMLKSDSSHVLLDISHCDNAHVLTHFPNIAAQCAKHGIDITKEAMPVAPAAHFMCGGVQTDLNGKTSIPGLYAAGEVAHTGLHGANRLASNSLLEGLVFAHRAVEPSARHADRMHQVAGRAMLHAALHSDLTGSKKPTKLNASQKSWAAAKRLEVQNLMWRSAGIVRCTKDMQTALCRMHEISFDTQAMCSVYGVKTELVELKNLVTVGRNILEAALARKESRGGHFNVDYAPKFREPPTKRMPREVFKKARKSGLSAKPRSNSPQMSRESVRDVVAKSQHEFQPKQL